MRPQPSPQELCLVWIRADPLRCAPGSRNVRLTKEERERALCISQGLKVCAWDLLHRDIRPRAAACRTSPDIDGSIDQWRP